MIMRLHNLGNFTMESEFARTSFETRVAEKISEVKQILPRMSRYFHRCDPKIQEEGKSFIRMTNFLQVWNLLWEKAYIFIWQIKQWKKF